VIFAPASFSSTRADEDAEEENRHENRAAIALEKGKPLTVTEVELEGPKPGEVLIEVKATGICHTDEFHAVRRRSGRAVSVNSGPRRRWHCPSMSGRA